MVRLIILLEQTVAVFTTPKCWSSASGAGSLLSEKETQIERRHSHIDPLVYCEIKAECVSALNDHHRDTDGGL